MEAPAPANVTPSTKNRRLRAILATATLLLLASCSTPTPYQRLGLSNAGGFTTNQLSATKYEIVFAGNEATTPERAYDFCLLRAAELTMELDLTRFVVSRTHDRSRTTRRYVSGMSGSTSAHTTRTTSGTYTTVHRTPSMPGHMTMNQSPGFSLVVDVYDANATIRAPQSMIFNADETARTLRAKYKLDAASNAAAQK
jgi:hypothetical protein